ncbi:bifunctional AP-4-A phosphorylase/ADP sulfurylase [Dinochytrium kinnereticum]|nr:bifunctional AP-4-A phosphorylase/ADP sulfurylase [Dinochytrium kinnereticum]
MQAAIHSAFESARVSGHLIFTESTRQIIKDGTTCFHLTLAPGLAKKPTGGLAPVTTAPIVEKKKNPFLPPEPTLHVSEYDWESQLDPLTSKDFEAAWQLVFSSGHSYLGFYNCGSDSGASVPHKHMQFIPYEPLVPPPILSMLESHPAEQTTVGTPFQLTVFKFAHAAARLPNSFDPTKSADIFKAVVHASFSLAGIDANSAFTIGKTEESPPHHNLSYNVVFTHQWILVVPRRCSEYQQFNVNSLGFAGMLLTKTQEEMEALKRVGPMNVLRNVAF